VELAFAILSPTLGVIVKSTTLKMGLEGLNMSETKTTVRKVPNEYSVIKRF